MPLNKLFCVAIVACCCSVALNAQVSTAELNGTVVDQSGAAIPNAKVTVTQTDTGVSRQTVSVLPAIISSRPSSQVSTTRRPKVLDDDASVPYSFRIGFWRRADAPPEK
jgi:hypothetical protein